MREAHISTRLPGFLSACPFARSVQGTRSLAAYFRLCPGPEALNGAKRKSAGIWKAPRWRAVPSARVTPGGRARRPESGSGLPACSRGAPPPGTRSILSPLPRRFGHAPHPRGPPSAPRPLPPPAWPRGVAGSSARSVPALGPRGPRKWPEAAALAPPLSLPRSSPAGSAGGDGGREGERAGSRAPGRGR